MADGKIEYELSVDARAGITSLSQATDAENKLAAAADRAAVAAERAAKSLKNISADNIRSAVSAIGMATVDIGSAYLESKGKDVAAGYLKSIAAGAISGGSLGYRVGGPQGAAIGAIIGGGTGAGKQYISNDTGENKQAQQLEKTLLGVHLNAELAVRSISRMDAPEQLEKTLEDISDKIYAIGYQASAGLIGKELAAVQIGELERVAQAARDALPGARARKAGEDLKEVSGPGDTRANRLTAMGGILSGSAGGMASAANDAARGTLDNTRRMVALLERIERAGSRETGGASWQP